MKENLYKLIESGNFSRSFKDNNGKDIFNLQYGDDEYCILIIDDKKYIIKKTELIVKLEEFNLLQYFDY